MPGGNTALKYTVKQINLTTPYGFYITAFQI